MLDVGAVVDEHPSGHVAADLELQDALRVAGGFIGRIGELDPAGLHPAAGQNLGLDDHRPLDLLGDPPRLLGRLGEPLLGDRDPGLGDYRPGLVLEEAHRAPGGYKSAA